MAGLRGTLAYLGNVTIDDRKQEEHDQRLKTFLTAFKSASLTLNQDNCVYSVSEFPPFGFFIAHNKSLQYSQASIYSTPNKANYFILASQIPRL